VLVYMCVHASGEYVSVCVRNIRLHLYKFPPYITESILDLFRVKKFSSKGSSALVKEQAAYMFFRNILEEIESKSCLCASYFCLQLYVILLGGGIGCSLEKVLAFFTGSEIIPPLAFDDIVLNYNHSNPFPTASTCGQTLTLPTKYVNYQDFKTSFLYAINNHGGFGLS